jgi:hypothetical protein
LSKRSGSFLCLSSRIRLPIKLSSVRCVSWQLNSNSTGLMYRSKSIVCQYIPLKKYVSNDTRVFVSMSIIISIMSRLFDLHARYSLLMRLLLSVFFNLTSSCSCERVIMRPRVTYSTASMTLLLSYLTILISRGINYRNCSISSQNPRVIVALRRSRRLASALLSSKS